LDLVHSTLATLFLTENGCRTPPRTNSWR